MVRHQQVTVIGVAGRDQRPAMEEFIERHGLGDMVTIADVDGAVWRRYGIVAQPAWVFLDAAGGQRRVLAALTRADLEARLDALSD